MRLGNRAFIFEQDGTIRRIGVAKLSACFHRELSGAVPEYAGTDIRIANVVVGLLNRRPARIVRTYFSVYRIDGSGLLDAAFRTELMHTSMNMVPSLFVPEDILEALRPDLAKLKLKDHFIWQPTPHQEAALRSNLFKTN